MGFGWMVHAFDASPPKGSSADALMLWGHKIPLCPSVPSSGPELVLTVLGDQEV